MRHGLVHQYNGNLYVRLFEHNHDNIAVWKSTDSGATWSQVSGGITTQLGNTFIPGCGTVSGSVMYITFNEYDFGATPDTSFISVARFDMATDTWLSTWTGTALAAGGGGVAFSAWNQCGVRSDGSLVIAYLHNEPIGIDFQRKWKYVTCDSSGVFGADGDLSSGWQTWNGVSSEAMVGPIAIDSADRAHFFYLESQSGSSTADLQTLHHSLTLAGSLSSASVAVDYTTTTGTGGGGNRTHPSLTATISGTESVLFAVGDGDGNGPDPEYPAVLYSDVTLQSWTYAVNTNFADHDQQWMCNLGSTVYGTWPESQVTGEYTGVRIGTFSGSWSGTETTVNDGAGGEPTWNWWTMNALGGDAIGFVLEDFSTEEPWFLRYPIVQSANRWYAF
jgi:hypothetical protein